jgi:hypothetical protein
MRRLDSSLSLHHPAPEVDLSKIRVSESGNVQRATCPVHGTPTVDSKGRPNACGLGVCI